jgi:hypothetical protein
MRPYPTREELAMELILRECGRDHDFPQAPMEEIGEAETETDLHGQIVKVTRVACRRCGMLQVTRWHTADPVAVPHTHMQAVLTIGTDGRPEPADVPGSAQPAARVVGYSTGTYERPEPADVPGLAQRAALVTDEEYAAFAAECGYDAGIPQGFAPDRRATAQPERLRVALQIRAGQFALLDRYESLGSILPRPATAVGTDLVDVVPGAALFWPPVPDGELMLPLLISPHAPEPDRSYASITEVSCRFSTGYVVLREIGGRTVELPPLPAGHGDYRLRFHAGEPGCLLQIWPQPRGKPRTRV